MFGTLALAVVYLSIMVPENAAFDARSYHLPIAEHYATWGRIGRFPEGWFAGALPHLASWLYTWPFTLRTVNLYRPRRARSAPGVRPLRRDRFLDAAPGRGPPAGTPRAGLLGAVLSVSGPLPLRLEPRPGRRPRPRVLCRAARARAPAIPASAIRARAGRSRGADAGGGRADEVPVDLSPRAGRFGDRPRLGARALERAGPGARAPRTGRPRPRIPGRHGAALAGERGVARQPRLSDAPSPVPLAADGAGVARNDPRSRVRADRDAVRKAPRHRGRDVHLLVRPARLADLPPGSPGLRLSVHAHPADPAACAAGAPSARAGRGHAARCLHLVLDLPPGSLSPSAAPLDGRLHGGRTAARLVRGRRCAGWRLPAGRAAARLGQRRPLAADTRHDRRGPRGAGPAAPVVHVPRRCAVTFPVRHRLRSARQDACRRPPTWSCTRST